jgi:hypothetical protein
MMIQEEMGELISQAWPTRPHHRFVVVYLCVGFEERILLGTVMQSRRLMWSDCLMVFSQVCEMILIVSDAD